MAEEDIVKRISRLEKLVCCKLTDFQDLPIYADNDEAILAGLNNGDPYLVFDNGIYYLAITYLFEADLLEFTAHGESANFVINNDGGANFNVDILWGDGTIEHLTGTNIYSISHVYVNGDYNVKVRIAKSATTTIKELAISSAGLTVFPDFTKFESLAVLDLSNNSLSSFNILRVPTTIVELNLSTNSYTSFNYDLSALIVLQNLLLNGNVNLLEFNPIVDLPITVRVINISNCVLDVTNVNSILVYLDSIAFTTPNFIDLSGQTPAATPTGAGATAATSLSGKGWTVTTD